MIANEDRKKASGLCMTCNHANFCIYLAGANSPIWCCEEFDDRPPIIQLKDNIQAVQPKPAKELKGLDATYAERQIRKAS